MRQIFPQKFWRDRCGQVAIFLALSLLPVVTVMGFALDVSRQVTTKKQLELATDIATLAAARKYAETRNQTQSQAVGQAYFNENIAVVSSDTTCRIKWQIYYVSPRSAAIKSECSIPTIFGISISGRRKVIVQAKSRAAGSHTTLDLALVLDMSGSMTGTKIDALKTAAKQLVNYLVRSDDDVRISIVPYSSGVNAGTFGHAARGTTAGTDPHGEGSNRVCVSERGGDDAFTDAKPESLATYVGPQNIRVRNCPTLPVLPLTSSKTELRGHIDQMRASGYTIGHVGTAWGWYSISPEWGDIWPAAAKPKGYGNPDQLKAIVLMTDGKFNLPSISAQGNALEQAESLCAAMRSRGVIVFTIAFEVSDSDALQLMQNCASKPVSEYYLEAANEAELKAAFNKVARKFQGVGLTE